MGRNTYKSGGFTLVELMVVLAVLAVLIGVAVPSFQNITNRNRLTAVTNEMVAALQLTRVEAIRRNARVVFCPTTDGAACGGTNWLRSIVVAPGGEVVREINFEGAGLVVSPSSSVDTGDQISFGASGFARAGTTAANRAGGLRVCSTLVNPDENARDVMVNVSRISVTTVASAECAVAPGNQ
ncbi:MAG: GspH/FimT family pseudopilin [Pseudomonadota bacterium]